MTEEEKQEIASNPKRELGTVKKSKKFIEAKYKSSLLETQLTSISLTRLKIVNGIPQATVYPGEIKDMLGKSSDTNIYRKLKKVATTMTGHQMVIEDGNGNFKAFSIITNANYENKALTITFNRELTPYINDIDGPFTKYELANTLQMKCSYSFRLYELLKMEAYRLNPSKPNDVVVKEYGVSELKCMIGLVNMDEVNVRKAVEKGVSWDDIVEKVAIEKSFEDWSSFKRRVLDKAKQELDEISDIKFEYSLLRYGTGGKVRKIRFFISLNDQDKQTISKLQDKTMRVKRNIKEFEQLNIEDYTMSDKVKSYIGHNHLTEEELFMLYETADFNEKKLLAAIELADKQTYIKNYVGWIRSCLINEYEQPIETLYGDASKAEAANIILEEVNEMHQEGNPHTMKLWKKIQQKPEYKDFLNFLESNDVDPDAIELIYDAAERIDMFIKWKKGETNIF